LRNFPLIVRRSQPVELRTNAIFRPKSNHGSRATRVRDEFNFVGIGGIDLHNSANITAFQPVNWQVSGNYNHVKVIESHSNSTRELLNVLQNLSGLLTCNARKPMHKLGELRPILEILE
jgi:hypothetical protein